MSGAAPPTPADAWFELEPAPPRPAPPARRGSLWASLFGDALSSVISVVAFALLMFVGPRFLDWAVLHGVFVGDGAACRAGGACWSFIGAKAPFILFGIYPAEERWRPLVVLLIFLALALWTLKPSRWTRQTLVAWLAGAALTWMLMAGGVLGLTAQPTSKWGGAPITVLLTVLSLGFGAPLAVALALGRQSQMRVVRWLSVTIIEVVRAVPVVSILFVASIMLPLMLPDGVNIDKLARALAALVVFSAAYMAEVLRGGLQGVPPGQMEGARALGLSWWQAMRAVILPQAVGKVIPPLTNTIVVIVKNTSLVLVVGLFDLLSAGRAALDDPRWPAPYAETYAFVALIYFAICFSISRYALWLEQRGSLGGAR
jgi:general L-amino acid transport system permease protein